MFNQGFNYDDDIPHISSRSTCNNGVALLRFLLFEGFKTWTALLTNIMSTYSKETILTINKALSQMIAKRSGDNLFDEFCSEECDDDYNEIQSLELLFY